MPACTKCAAEPEANEGTLGREKFVLCVVPRNSGETGEIRPLRGCPKPQDADVEAPSGGSCTTAPCW